MSQYDALYIRKKVITITLLLFSLTATAHAAGFTTTDDWNETAVRKVLHTFTYGGFASDQQIKTWSRMSPEQAIQEILSFDPVNPKLSPAEDASYLHGDSLEAMQAFWGRASNDNPVRSDQQAKYPLMQDNGSGGQVLSPGHLQLTWVQAATTRGLNPFLHRVGFYLTNYHMALTLHKTRAGLMRDYYDRTIEALIQGKDFIDVLAQGATSAATAYAYGHQWNWFNNNNGRFYGNDDFAREFHQLFFRIQGISEDQDYHENTTIEHTAWALTGMRLDRSNPWGSSDVNDWPAAPINFSDHSYIRGDNAETTIYNQRWHHTNELEILHTSITGTTAQEKIHSLARVAGYHPESLDNIPVTIIDYFADDNLNAEKIADIRAAWRAQEPKLLLEFLRSYAISTAFHRRDTIKYRSAFERNLLVQNFNTVDNLENFSRSELPINQMKLEGAEVFVPAHDVFGGQTGLQAANNPNIFKDAYSRNVLQSGVLARTTLSNPALPTPWTKDWAKLIPKNGDGEYEVKKVASWLWRRFIGDGGKNLKIQEQAHLYALLATGYDLGYLVDPTNPEQAFTNEQLDNDPIKDIFKTNEEALMQLDSSDPAVRLEANRRVGLAVNFISMTPFMFAMEGK